MNADHDHKPIIVTMFKDLKADESERIEIIWDDVVDSLSNPSTHESKAHCPLINFASFGDTRTAAGSLRHDKNVLKIHGVIGDYDAEKMTVDEAAALCEKANIEVFIYTSASHGVIGKSSKGGPRWRILAPLSGPTDRDQHYRLVARLNGALGGVLAGESFTLSQSYYFGRVKGVAYETRRIHGEFLDLRLDLPEIGKPAKVKKAGKPKTIGTAGAGKPESKDQDPFTEQVGPDTISHLRSALMEGLAASWAADRGQWIDVGQSLKSLVNAGASDGEALELWHQFSARCAEKYEPAEVDKEWLTFNPTAITYRSIFYWAQEEGWVNPAATEGAGTLVDRTDVGNMNLLAKLTSGDLRFIPETRTWIFWDGSRWVPDPQSVRAQKEALRVSQKYLDELKELRQQEIESELQGPDLKYLQKEILALAAWIRSCRSKKNIEAMLVLATKDARFVLGHDQLDTDPWLFGVANGVVDLRTGAIKVEARDDYVTKRSPYDYDPRASAPLWQRVIAEITGVNGADVSLVPRPALQMYVHRLCGYLMTGVTNEHKIFFMVGEGSNGKSLLMEAQSDVMGSYVAIIPAAVLMEGRYDSDPERPTPAIRKLAGARLALASESKDDARLDVAMVKRHTGDRFLTARGLQENGITFPVTHKLVLLTNNKPAIPTKDNATRGRIHMIPFDAQWNRPGLPDPDPELPTGDKGLGDALRTEGPGILNWLIQGAVAYHTDGLQPPKEVADMTREYLQGVDPFKEWFAEFELAPVDQGIGATDLLNVYKQWCTAQGHGSGADCSAKSFADKLSKCGVEGTRTKAGKVYGVRKVETAVVFGL